MTESLESEMPSPVINASASDDGRVVGIYRFRRSLFPRGRALVRGSFGFSSLFNSRQL